MHDAVTTDLGKAQHMFGKLVNHGRHAAHTTSLRQVPETTKPTGTRRSAGRKRDQDLQQGSLQEVCKGQEPLRTLPSGAVNGLATG